MQASLVLVRSNGKQHDVPLKKARLLVGRQPECQVRLNDPGVSRQHCELIVEDKRIAVKDLGSSNGTYVNKRRVSQTDLEGGDLIAIGPFVFVVIIDGNPASVDARDVLSRGAVAVGGASPSAIVNEGVKTRGTTKHAPVVSPKPKSDDSDAFDALAGGTKDDSSEFDFDFLAKDDERPKL